MSFQEAISKRIFDLCQKHNITPNHLAEISCIPPSTLQNLTECKVSNPSSFVLFQLCLALNITLKDFFDCDLFNKDNINI